MGVIRKGKRTGRRWLRLGIALAALACVAASGQPSFEGAALRGQLRAGGFSAVQTQAALAVLDDASSRGLPARALVNRLREGLTRHAEPAVILQVLADRRAVLTRADALAQRCASHGIAVRDREGSLTRLADSLSMGVTHGDVVSLLPAASSAHRDLESVSRAAEVMGRLVRRGFPPAETRDVLRAALGAGWTRNQTDGLVAVYVEARRLGVPGERTRQTLAVGIRDGKGLNRLTADVREGAKADAASHAAGRSRPPSSAAKASGTGAAKGARGGSPSRGPGVGGRGAPPRPPGPRQSAPRPPGPRMRPPHH